MNQHHPYPSSIMRREYFSVLASTLYSGLPSKSPLKGDFMFYNKLYFFWKRPIPLLIGIFIGWCCFLCSGTFLLYLIRCLFIIYNSKFYFLNQHHPYPSSVMMRGIIRRLLTQAKICLTHPNLPKGRLIFFIKSGTSRCLHMAVCKNYK